MAFPLDLFITPVTKPWEADRPVTSIGEFGQMLNDNANRKRMLGQQDAHFQQEMGLRQRQAAESERWHKDAVDARREMAHEKNELTKEKRVNTLLDALKKAVRLNQRAEADMIRQELSSMGYKVEEVASEYQDPAEAVASEGPAPGGPGPLGMVQGPKPGKAPPVDPSVSKVLKPGMKPGKTSAFGPALDAYMAGEGGASPEPKPELGSPFPWESLGLGAPPEKPTATPGRGGRFIVRDKQGNLVQSFDQGMETQRQAQAILQMMAPRIGDTSTPEKQKAADKAAKAGVAALEVLPVDKAVQLATDAYFKEMGTYKDQKLPSTLGSGGGGVVSKEERMRMGAFSDDVKDIINQVKNEYNTAATEKASAIGERGLSMLEGDSGFMDAQALGQLMKEMSGLTVSDRERAFIEGSEGKIAEYQRELNKWIGSGRLPPELQKGLRDTFARAIQVHRNVLEKGGNQAYEQVQRRILTASPEERERVADAARGFFTGSYQLEREAPKGAPKAGPRPSGPGPVGASPPSDDERRKKLLEKMNRMGL